MDVPFVDLKAQYRAIKAEIDPAIQAVIDSAAFVGGRFVEAFERAFAEKCGVAFCVSCASGTDAIYITLKALGIGPGDEVITAANTFFATSEAVGQTGAKPIFVDIEEDYYHLDPQLIEARITPRTKAVIPVHLFGQPAKLDEIREICARRRLLLIEDCAQAHCAEFRGQRVGTFGVAGAYSFYPGKNLGAYGDAGAIITNDESLARSARMFANHGSLKKHEHDVEGVNSRLDGIQAAVLGVKLNHVDLWNKARHEHALKYSQLLSDCLGVKCPKIRPDADHIFHLYVIRAQRRDELMNFLGKRGISTGLHYPTALPFLGAYRHLGHTPSDFPAAYRCQKEILSLPMYPELNEEQIRWVADSIKEFYRA